MDEYQNTLTKMFGDSTGCPSGKHCDRTLTSTCPMTTGCHGYRNASAYLNSRHVDSAVANLEKHAFFGLRGGPATHIRSFFRQRDHDHYHRSFGLFERRRG